MNKNVHHCQPLESSKAIHPTNDDIDDNVSSDSSGDNDSGIMRSLDNVLEEASSFPTTTTCFDHPTTTKMTAWSEWRYWRIFLCLGICSSSDATEIFCFSYILADSDFQNEMLTSSSGQAAPWRASILASIIFAGMLIGGLSVSVVGDQYGRKPVLLNGLTMNAIAGTMAALFSSNIWMLTLFRFIGGMGIGFSVPPLFTLTAELAPARDRGFWGAFVASFWMVGSIFVALVAWIVLEGSVQGGSWRMVVLVCTAPSALGYILCRSWVPESPRYLALQGKHQEAVDVMERLTLRNLRSECPPWTLQEALYQYSSLSPSLKVKTDTKHFTTNLRQMLLDFFQRLQPLYSQQLRETSWGLQATWFALCFGTYGLSIWINTLFVEIQLENIYGNALIFAVSSIPANVLTTLILDKWGRSTVLSGSLFMAALSLLAFAYIAHADDATTDNNSYDSKNVSVSVSPFFKRLVVLSSACIFQFCTVVAWGSITVLTPELYPTAVRNSGMAMSAASGRMGALVAQIVAGCTVQKKPSHLLSTVALTLLLGALSPYCWLPPDKARQRVQDCVATNAVDGLLSSPNCRLGYDLEDGNNERKALLQTTSSSSSCSITPLYYGDQKIKESSAVSSVP